MKKLIAILAIAGFCALVILLFFRHRDEAFLELVAVEGSKVGYVIGEDKRVYKIDLKGEKILFISDPVQYLGKPVDIDFDARNGRLYVGSERGANSDYSPLVYIPVGLNEDVIGSAVPLPVITPLGAETLEVKEIKSPVARLVLSPINDELYVGFIGPEFKLTAVVDRFSGIIEGALDAAIMKKHEFSPDGLQVAEIYPSGERVGNGGATIWNGGVSVLDIQVGKWGSPVELQSNRGLQPPWAELSTPFFYFRSSAELEVYSRNSGELIRSLDLFAITGLRNAHDHLVYLPNQEIALTMVNEEEDGFVVKVNYMSGREVSRLKIGRNPSPLVAVQ